jgi:hypothetical protein
MPATREAQSGSASPLEARLTFASLGVPGTMTISMRCTGGGVRLAVRLAVGAGLGATVMAPLVGDGAVFVGFASFGRSKSCPSHAHSVMRRPRDANATPSTANVRERT